MFSMHRYREYIIIAMCFRAYKEQDRPSRTGKEGIYMKKMRTLCIFLVCAALLLCACGENGAKMSAREYVSGNPEAIEGLTEMPVDLIYDLTGLETEKYTDILFYESEDGLGASCLIVLVGKDAAAADEAESCLNNYLEQRKDETRNYLPEDYALLEKAVLKRKGNTVLLCAGKNSEKTSSGIMNGI